MNKRFILFALVLALIAPCVIFLSACGEQVVETKCEQTSNLVIENVYQNSYGAVIIEFENAYQYMSVQNNEGTISYDPTIEVSCDNGTNWENYYFRDYTNLNSGIILYYNEINNNYLSVNSILTSNFSIGFEANIIARLKENDTHYASNSTDIYYYTLKTVIPYKHISWFYVENEEELTGAIARNSIVNVNGQEEIHYDDRFEYFDNNEICTVNYVLYLYNNSVVKIGTVSVSEDSYTVTQCANYENFEYRFYKDNGSSNLLEDMDSYNNYNYNNIGWNPMSSIGITFTTNNTYEQFDSTFLNILIREKETSEKCFSTCCSAVFEIITD
ncbi:MAG: hypothetical protein WCR30_01005 [Clostridia bacterium]